MSIARKILKSTFAQVAGKAITALLAVLVVKILSNYLSKSGYGDYGTVYEFLAFFGAMADLGIFTIAVREMSSSKNSEKIFQNSLTLRTLTTTIAMSLGVIVAFLITRYQGTYIPYGIAIASIATWLVILSGTLSIALQARLKMEYQAIALVLGKILTVGAIITTVNTHPIATKQSFYLLLWAGVAGSFLTFLLTYILPANL
ncbi:MAG: oligosaccharide flippase family protein [Candidatus Gracilibacteria bacterium]|jgi:O-antigen/teichoic acid export membrane protein|nr:oligosaccharide flippase family protein [Candidatus Gracilibacteria bacterium]